MKKIIPLFALLATACSSPQNTATLPVAKTDSLKTNTTMKKQFKSGYAAVNGLNMYYEIHGSGKPLVLIHGGGSTINSTFGRVLPFFSMHHQVIAVELQAHGRTLDIDRPLSFAQDADDVAALLQQLQIQKADVMGFSNGGSTTLQLAIRHPELVDRIIAISAVSKRSGLQPWFFPMMEKASLDNMPPLLKAAYLEVSPQPGGLEKMFHRDADRMLTFKDWPDAQLKSIKAKSLIMIPNQDVVTPEHALEMSRLIPKAQLVILPGMHGEFMGEITMWKEENRKLVEGFETICERFLTEEDPKKE